MEKRETRYRVQWYYRLFEETQRGLTWGTSVEVVHGSLLALGELLRHTGKTPIGNYNGVSSKATFNYWFQVLGLGFTRNRQDEHYHRVLLKPSTLVALIPYNPWESG